MAYALSPVQADWPFIESEDSAALLPLVLGPTFTIMQQLRQENLTDSFLQVFHVKHQQGTLEPPFSIVQGLVLHKGRYVICPDSSLCNLILHEFHDTPSGGHAGVKRCGEFFLASHA